MEKSAKKPVFDFNGLSQNDTTIVEYVWIGGTGFDIRSKAKTYRKEVNTLEDVDEWNFDGSSTYLARTESSEVVLKPVALFKDPFRQGSNKIVLCSTYYTDGRPTMSNFRHYAEKILTCMTEEHEPWFGIEQEYVLTKPLGTTQTYPVGWPIGGYPTPQGPYYCSVGSRYAFGREIIDAHYRACLYAGVQIYGINAEVMPGQWEFQIGTSQGIEAADHLWIARYLLLRVGEYFDMDINFHPKPFSDWNGSGCHTNFSTKGTRSDVKMKVILDQIKDLELSHSRLIAMYGENNQLRLTGKHETSSIEKFSFGVANRGTSIRIPLNTEQAGKGYYEDRRPASNMDPYVVCSSIYSVTCLDGFGLDDLEKHYTTFLKIKKNI